MLFGIINGVNVVVHAAPARDGATDFTPTIIDIYSEARAAIGSRGRVGYAVRRGRRKSWRRVAALRCA